MAEPLFTKEEMKAYHAKAQEFWDSRADDSWDRREALKNAHNVKRALRVRQRAIPFLEGFIILVGSKGSEVADLYTWYEQAGTEDGQFLLDQHNTPENRRVLYTILRALGEIPKTWARSAFGRHLRGQGKQKDTGYYGNGVFGAGSGWTQRELDPILIAMADGNNASSEVLVYLDPQFADYPDAEMFEAAYAAASGDANPFAMTLVHRDTEFINVLCGTLEHMGLGPEMDKPAPKRKPKTRKPKVFKVGNKVTARNKRDLLPGATIKPEKWDEHRIGGWSGHFYGDTSTPRFSELAFVLRDRGRGWIQGDLIVVATGKVFEKDWKSYNTSDLHGEYIGQTK